MRVPADLQDGLPTEENAPGAKTFSVTDVLSAILLRIRTRGFPWLYDESCGGTFGESVGRKAHRRYPHHLR